MKIVNIQNSSKLKRRKIEILISDEIIVALPLPQCEDTKREGENNINIPWMSEVSFAFFFSWSSRRPY